MKEKNDKRERLVAAAKILMLKKGYNETTLAYIALEADVPLGNVYYYFNTKEAIAKAVLASLLQELTERLAGLDHKLTPLARLNGYIEQVMSETDWTLQYGDKLGSLCQELAKSPGTLADISANLMHYSVNWLEKQFTELGSDNPKLQAILFIARLQGMSLLATTFNDDSYLLMVSKWLKADLATNVAVANIA